MYDNWSKSDQVALIINSKKIVWFLKKILKRQKVDKMHVHIALLKNICLFPTSCPSSQTRGHANIQYVLCPGAKMFPLHND